MLPALVAKQSILAFLWEVELLLSFFQLPVAFVYDTRYLSASFSAQIDSVLNLCDNPVAVSVIISAALVPVLSLLLNELFKFVVSVNKELANSFQLSHSSFFSSRAISLSWSDAFLAFKAHEHVKDGPPTVNP